MRGLAETSVRTQTGQGEPLSAVSAATHRIEASDIGDSGHQPPRQHVLAEHLPLTERGDPERAAGFLMLEQHLALHPERFRLRDFDTGELAYRAVRPPRKRH